MSVHRRFVAAMQATSPAHHFAEPTTWEAAIRENLKGSGYGG